MKKQAAEHKEVVDGLQRKIQWYVDNQALLTQNDGLIASQKAMILDLQAKLENASKVQVSILFFSFKRIIFIDLFLENATIKT